MALTKVSGHIIDQPFDVGIITATNQYVSGIGTFGNIRVLGDLQIDGTTTTLDTVVTEVDRLEVGANNSTVGVAITQSGTGDILSLYDGATEVFTVADGGNVGINKNAPTSVLDIRQTNTGAATEIKLFNLDQSNATTQTAALVMTPDLRANGVKIVAVKEVADMSSSANKDLALTFQTVANNTAVERLRITSDGKVGIGLTNPGEKLSVNGGIEARGGGWIIARSGNSSGYAYIKNPEASGSQLAFLTSDTERLRITSGGSVGIGTTNPLTKIHIDGTDGGNSTLFISASDLDINHGGTISLGANYDGTNRTSFGQIRGLKDNNTSGQYGGYLSFLTRTNGQVPAERLRIDSAGMVGINMTPAAAGGSTYMLQMYNAGSQCFLSIGNGTSGNGPNNGLVVGNDANHSYLWNREATTILFGTSNTERLRITSGGDVGIGVTNPTSFGPTLQVAGTDPALLLQDTATAVDYFGMNIASGAVNTWFDDASALVIHTATGISGSGLSEKLRITSDGKVRVPDGGKFTAGAGDDLQIYHDGSKSLIADSGAGHLEVNTNDFRVQNAAANETIITGTENGAVDLYYDNSRKFQTTATGAKVTGALEVTQEYPSIRPTLDLNFAATKTLDRRITFTRDSLGTFTDKNGLIKYASNNVPRFNHDPITGESLGLLIEEARTNYSIYSSEFDNAAHSKLTATVVANQAVAPDGTNTADLLYPNSSGSGRGITDSYTLTTGIYTTSLYVKSAGLQWIALYGVNGAGRGYFDIVNGTAGGSDSTGLVTYGIEDAGNGWYRCYVTINITDVSGTEYYYVYFGDSDNSVSVTANGTNGIYIWGLQTEKGAFKTSYIPTSGTTVTRAQDTAKITGTNFTDFYNQTEGTAFINVLMPNSSGASGLPAYAFKTSANSNYHLGFSRDNTGAYHYVKTSDADTFVYESLVNEYRAVLGIKTNDLNSYINDANQNVNLSTVTLFDADILHLGSTTTTNVLNGHIKRFSYYPKRLPDAQLQGLTQQ